MSNQQLVRPGGSGLQTFDNPKDLLTFLERGKSAIQMALPKHLNPDRMLRLALTSFSTTPALRNCTGQSILASIVVASQLGLEPGVAGQGYLIPYKNTCTFVPGWQGLVSLLNNSGRATVWSGSVFDGDEWEFQLGSNPVCRHVPGDNYGDPEKLIWVYACGQVNGSERPVIEAWPISRVKKHRDRYNKVGDRHYSFQNFEMYARKVVVLQVLKYMPRSIELNNAIVASDAAELGKSTAVQDGVVIETEPGGVEVIDGPPPAAKQTPADAEPSGGEMDYAEAVYKLIKNTPGVTEEKIIAHMRAIGKMNKNQTELRELSNTKLRDLFNDWSNVREEGK